MKKNENQQVDGGKDASGFEEFVLNVNQDDFDNSGNPDIELDLGDGAEGDKGTEPKKEEPKEGEAPKGEEPKKEEQEESKTDTTKKVEEEEEQEEPKQNQSNSYYANLAKKFIEKGKWQDAELELEDGTVKKLSEIENLDEEIFFQVEENQSKFKEEDIKNNYINKSDFDENKLKLIEILKEGGDIKDIFKTPQEAVRPFENADLEDEGFQQSVFYQYLIKAKSIEPEDAKLLLKSTMERGELGDKVKTIVEGYQKDYDNRLTQKLEEVKKAKEAQREKDKEFTKNLKEVYKGFNINEKEAKKLADLALKRDDSGDFAIDSVYSEKMEDPQEAAELIQFLTDKEGYLKSKLASNKINTQKGSLRQIKVLSDKDKKTSKESVRKPNDGSEEFVINIE